MRYDEYNQHPQTLSEALDLNYFQITDCEDYPLVGDVYVKHNKTNYGIIFNNVGQFGGIIVIATAELIPYGVQNSFEYRPFNFHGIVILSRPPGESCTITNASKYSIGTGTISQYIMQ